MLFSANKSHYSGPSDGKSVSVFVRVGVADKKGKCVVGKSDSPQPSGWLTACSCSISWMSVTNLMTFHAEIDV